MEVNKLLDIMKLAEESIWSAFGLENGQEYIDDLTNCNWTTTADECGDISIMICNESRSFEIYGSSFWKCDEFSMAKIYNGSGETYCILMLNKYRLTDEDYDEMEAHIEEIK